MKTCKVRPSIGECRMCIDAEDFFGAPNCAKCVYNTSRYQLISIESGIFNDHAFIQLGGKITKVSLDRVYDIKEE